MLIREVMTTPAFTVTTRSTTGTALRLMEEEQISSLPVVDDRGALLGIISAADLQAGALADDQAADPAGRVRGMTPPARVGNVMTHDVVTAAPSPRRVGDVMTHGVVTVGPADEIEVAIDRMRSTAQQYLPVVANDRVVGTVGRVDLVRLFPGRGHFFEFETSAGTASAADPVRTN